MKNIYQIILLALTILVTSCGTLDKGHSKKEQMKIDAYALANTQCEYEIAKIVYDTNTVKARYKADRVNKKNELTVLQQKFFRRYRDNENDYDVFRKMVESVTPELSTCRKLEAIKEELEAKQEEEGKDKKETK